MNAALVAVGFGVGAVACGASFWLGWLARGAMKRFQEIVTAGFE